MVNDPTGFLRRMQPLSAKEMRKKGAGINFLTKREKTEMQLARLQEKEEKLQVAKRKKEADLQLLNDEDDGFRVKISLADNDVLKKYKLDKLANPDLFAQYQEALG